MITCSGVWTREIRIKSINWCTGKLVDKLEFLTPTVWVQSQNQRRVEEQFRRDKVNPLNHKWKNWGPGKMWSQFVQGVGCANLASGRPISVSHKKDHMFSVSIGLHYSTPPYHAILSLLIIEKKIIHKIQELEWS